MSLNYTYKQIGNFFNIIGPGGKVVDTRIRSRTDAMRRMSTLQKELNEEIQERMGHLEESNQQYNEFSLPNNIDEETHPSNSSIDIPVHPLLNVDEEATEEDIVDEQVSEITNSYIDDHVEVVTSEEDIEEEEEYEKDKLKGKFTEEEVKRRRRAQQANDPTNTSRRSAKKK